MEYRLVRIALYDILYIDARKDYVKVELKSTGKAIFALTSLKALEEKLSRKHFLRVHRSFIISLDKTTSMTNSKVNIAKKLIAIGDQYRDAYADFIEKWT